MKLKNLDFGHVVGQSGVSGFFGEEDEYPHYKYFRKFPGFTPEKMGFVAKTITLYPRIYPESSNTELRTGFGDDYKLKHMFPKSIWWSPHSVYKGYMLNAVGLANPGAMVMLNYNKWQTRRDVFQISFMPVETTREGMIRETIGLCKLLAEKMPFGKLHRYGLQVNFSCPNTGHEGKQDVGDCIAVLSVIQERLPNVPLIPKFDLRIGPKAIAALMPYCDAFCIGNSIPFGALPDQIDWEKLFPGGKSPLEKYFGGRFKGGLSGAPLFLPLVKWLMAMEEVNPRAKIIAGGGIMTKSNIERVAKFTIVELPALGGVATLRPYRVESLIDHANKIFSQRKTIRYEGNHPYQFG